MPEDTKTVYRYAFIDIPLSFLDISKLLEAVLRDALHYARRFLEMPPHYSRRFFETSSALSLSRSMKRLSSALKRYPRR